MKHQINTKDLTLKSEPKEDFLKSELKITQLKNEIN